MMTGRACDEQTSEKETVEASESELTVVELVDISMLHLASTRATDVPDLGPDGRWRTAAKLLYATLNNSPLSKLPATETKQPNINIAPHHNRATGSRIQSSPPKIVNSAPTTTIHTIPTMGICSFPLVDPPGPSLPHIHSGLNPHIHSGLQTPPYHSAPRVNPTLVLANPPYMKRFQVDGVYFTIG